MATKSSEIRAAWVDKIWENKSILQMTNRIFLHDVSVDSSFDMAGLYYSTPSTLPAINFFLCLIVRRQEPLIMGNTRYTFQVRVEYYVQQEELVSNSYNTLIDRLEVVDDLVRTELTGDWDGTVDFYSGGTLTDVTVVTIDDKACWKGGIVYIGTKTV